jgi:quercetin dioxygenase-like cupin family protein
MRVTRHAAAPGYQAAAHHGVATLRLQGHEAGPTDRFWVGLSYYLPGGGADETPAGEETVYVVLDGSLVVQADGKEEELGPLDSVHVPKGTVRRVDNRSARPATLLVIIGNRPPAGGEAASGAAGR